jgi:hypothetical protein
LQEEVDRFFHAIQRPLVVKYAVLEVEKVVLLLKVQAASDSFPLP